MYNAYRVKTNFHNLPIIIIVTTNTTSSLFNSNNNQGHKPWGWPMTFEDSEFLGSPILYDIDGDGKDDIGVIDNNGNVFFIRIGEYGQYLEDYHMQVPRLRVAKKWYEGLDEDFIDTYASKSMFDKGSRRGPVSSKDINQFHSDNNNNNNADGAETIDVLKQRPQAGKLDELSGLKPQLGSDGITAAKPPELKLDSSSGKIGSSSEERTHIDTNVIGRRLNINDIDIDRVNPGGDIADPGIPDQFGVPNFGEGPTLRTDVEGGGEEIDLDQNNNHSTDFGDNIGDNVDDYYLAHMQL